MKNFIPHFIQARWQAGETHGFLRGYTMFIDLSGFTALTESLMERGNEGAERLSDVLNNIFSPMVDTVYQRGGIIPYFAGDAFTAIFPDALGPDFTPSAFLGTARSILNLFSAKGFTFDAFEIGIKIGLSYGMVEWGIVGDEPQTFYFRGPAIDACAESEMRANQQEIILDRALFNQLPPNFPVTPTAHEDYMLLPGDVQGQVPPAARAPADAEALDPTVLRRFIPDAILDSAADGEFRNVVAVFISFRGVENHATLNAFVTVVLRQFDNFSGYFKEVDFGDKGGVLVGFFGAPVSYENNLERAVECILTIRTELQELQQQTNLRCRVGMTFGTAYTGIIGGRARCQYAAVGNRVNIAARLMTYANWDEILVDEGIQALPQYKFQHKGDIHYKGVSGDVPTYKLVGRNTVRAAEFDGGLVGRDAELDTLTDYLKVGLLESRPTFAYVYGDVGAGKTRLVHALRRRIQRNISCTWLVCETDQILRKPFNPFIAGLRRFFEQAPEQDELDNRRRFDHRYEQLLQDTYRIQGTDTALVKRELRRTQPILAALVGLETRDTVWERLDARGRFENTQLAIANLYVTLAMIRPLVIQLEDGQWFDENSKELLRRICRQLPGLPVVWLCTARPLDDGSMPTVVPPEVLDQLGVTTYTLPLDGLDEEAVAAFALDRLGGPVTSEFRTLLKRTTGGNPFYLEQVLVYFRESNLLVETGAGWQVKDDTIKLSDSISSILTARIDRLSNLVKETVKTAAVIGREFEVPVLFEVLEQQHLLDDVDGERLAVLREQIQTAERGQIWQAMSDLRYLFRNSLLREVVYDMQLRARLRELHGLIAQAIEKHYAPQLDQRSIDLAYHYEQAENVPKTLEYLQRGIAYARANYQNRQAIQLYDRLLPYLERREDDVEARIEAYMERSALQERIGRWDPALESLQTALELANRHGALDCLSDINNQLGHLMLLRGEYDKADTYLRAAHGLIEKDGPGQTAAAIYGNLGTLAFRQARYSTAQGWFSKSIQLNEARGDGLQNSATIVDLAMTYMNLGQFDEGIKWIQAQLTQARRADDRNAMATLHTHLGIVYFEKADYDEALHHYEKGLALAEELGNKRLTAIATGCLGSLYEKRGNYEKAMQLYRRDLQLVRELGDRQGIAIALGLVGELEAIVGNNDAAIRYLTENLELSRQLGYRKGVAKAVNVLGDIYFWDGEYDRARDYYREAIHVAREIGNQPVLCESLIELGWTHLRRGELNTTEGLLVEAEELLEQLSHEELRFRAALLRVRWLHAGGNKTAAVGLLDQLLAAAELPQRRASLHYERYRYTDDTRDRHTALELYGELYQRTPRISYRRRLDQLQH